MSFISNLAIGFHEVVRSHGSRTALLYPDSGERVTYAQLQDQTERIARRLMRAGLRQGDVAVMLHDKSPAAFAAMLACLRLGIIYANLDPDSPWERVCKILGTCQPRIIINAFVQMPFRDECRAVGFADVLDLRDIGEEADGSALPDPAHIDGGAPAYIMFTSGSTGNPKGAVISHANLLWFTAWTRDRFGITPDDVLSNVNPIYFDNSVFDFYSAIFSGASLVPLAAAQVRDARLVVRLIGEARCTIWFSVPSMLVYLLTTRALKETDFPAIRKIIFGGEGFPKARLRQLYELFGARADLENVYGPTECTCICSAHTIRLEDFDDMQSLAPLGYLAQNFAYEILASEVDEPDAGELFLRGPLVGLGYYNDKERSTRSFVQNPRHARYSDIGYRTGDLVRRGADGRLHFRGRADFQIKHMGYRIELEEVEAGLAALPEVQECAVIYHKRSDGLGQILAYAVLNRACPSQELLQKLALLLPSYMLPRQLTVLEVLPKNANGKIDRVALQGFAANQTTS